MKGFIVVTALAICNFFDHSSSCLTFRYAFVLLLKSIARSFNETALSIILYITILLNLQIISELQYTIMAKIGLPRQENGQLHSPLRTISIPRLNMHQLVEQKRISIQCLTHSIQMDNIQAISNINLLLHRLISHRSRPSAPDMFQTVICLSMVEMEA